jgi:hypothetical protein
MQKTRRKPSDYPQFAFRTTDEFKERINNLVEEVTELYNKQIPEGEYIYRKNDIIAEALEIGLMQMKKNPAKRSARKD